MNLKLKLKNLIKSNQLKSFMSENRSNDSRSESKKEKKGKKRTTSTVRKLGQ